MMSSLSRTASFAARYFSWLFKSGNEHSVHGPFLFDLLTKSLYDKSTDPSFIKIEALRHKLLNDHHEIHVVDLGAGSSYDLKSHLRSIRFIASHFAKSPSHCRFLFRLVRHIRPAVMLELGTSLGISALYQWHANPSGTCITLEGCPETAEQARKNFSMMHAPIQCITGNFDETLPAVLLHTPQIDYAYIDGNHTYEATLRYFNLLKPHLTENSVVVFDDIYWSEGMVQAWKEIVQDPLVTQSVDFFQFGVVFTNKNLSKENFRLRM